MTEHLQPKPLIIAKRFKFHKRNQGSSETVSRYLAELRRLADKCKCEGYLDEALHDRFICGLHSKVIQRRLLGEEELSLKKALEIAHGMEIANQKASQFHTSVESKMSDNIMMIPSARTPCYRCNKVGHSPDSCYFRKQKCRSCGKIGHIAKACQTADKKLCTSSSSYGFSPIAHSKTATFLVSSWILFAIKYCSSRSAYLHQFPPPSRSKGSICPMVRHAILVTSCYVD